MSSPSWGDDEITSADGLIIALRSHEVGEKVEITLMRGKGREDGHRRAGL